MALAKFAAQAAMAGFFVATAMLYRYTPYCSGVVCVGGGGGSGSAPGGGGGSNTPDVPSDDSRGFFTIAAITAAEDDDEVVEVSSNWNDKSKVSQLILDRRLYHKTIYIFVIGHFTECEWLGRRRREKVAIKTGIQFNFGCEIVMTFHRIRIIANTGNSLFSRYVDSWTKICYLARNPIATP